MTSDDVRAAARACMGRGAGVADAVYRHALAHGEVAPEAAGLGPRTAGPWLDHFAADHPELRWVERSGAGDHAAAKAVLGTADGLEFECVHIPMGRGRTSMCLSTQVGCARACAFCETGRMGLLRNLDPHEIVAQVVVTGRELGWRPRSLVYMGMGEPMDNVAGLMQSLMVFTDGRGLGYSHDRITVCTVGHVDGIHRLKGLGWRRLNLNLSLNAADDGLRRELMPIAKRWPLADVQRALVGYRMRKNLAFGIHYCLLPGINDRRQDAAGIARFCAPLGRVMVQLIPYNPGTDPLTRKPTEAEIVRFVGWLRDEGLPVRRRITKGDDVMAACGQLGNLALRRRHR